MARYVREGVDVLVVTCTGGERRSILNPAMDRPDVLADIANIRAAEMDRAREILGRDLDNVGARLAVQMALKIRRALPASS